VEVILPQLVLTPKCLIFRHMTLPVSRYVLGGELKRSDGAQLPVLVIRSSCFTQWRPMPVHDVTYGNSKAHYFLLSHRQGLLVLQHITSSSSVYSHCSPSASWLRSWLHVSMLAS
jgi:hypothetical protein